jgi:beta-galactosidase
MNHSQNKAIPDLRERPCLAMKPNRAFLYELDVSAQNDGESDSKSTVHLPRLTALPTHLKDDKPLKISLNGKWQFNPNPSPKFWETKSDDGKGWDSIDVPGEWAMQGFEVKPWTPAAYRRICSVPKDWSGMRIKIRCEAVYSKCTVWVNNVEFEKHVGGFTPFELDITDVVRVGEDNTIIMSVQNESIADFAASGSWYAGHPLGGITRKIYLFAVPQVNIASFHVGTEFDEDYKDANLKVMLDIANDGGAKASNVHAELSLTGPDEEKIAISPNSINFGEVEAGEIINRVIDIPIDSPKKWDSEHPNLYILKIKLFTDNEWVQTYRRVGFRQVEIRGNQLYVNNQPVKLHGVNRHETHPTQGRSLSAETCKKDAQLIHGANCNFVRTSHYPPSEEFIEACDELGIFVLDEAPFCWIDGEHMKQHKRTLPDNPEPHEEDPEFRPAILNQTLAMLERDRSHPSVILWSLVNESKWSSHFALSSKLVRKLDPSRPQMFSRGVYHELDFRSLHYPDQQTVDDEKEGSKPVLFDEFAHLAAYNFWEVATDPGINDGWGKPFAAFWDSFYKAEGILGGTIWAGIDEVFHMPSGKMTGYAEWGIIDKWRRPKPGWWHVKKGYSPIRVFQTTVPAPSRGESVKIEVTNRYNFSNLSEIQCEWILDQENGIAKMDVPARSTGNIEIRPKQTDLEGKEIILRFMDSNNSLVDTEKITIGQVCGTSELKKQQKTSGSCTVEYLDSTILVEGDSFRYEFDCLTGMIKKGEIKGQKVLIDGPILMLLPIDPFDWGLILPDKDTRHWPTSNNTCTAWKAFDIKVRQSEDGVSFLITGGYKEALGTYTIKIDNAGQITVGYEFTNNAGTLTLRQYGLVFRVAKDYDTLSWKRKSQWTIYPEDHIGRPEGQTKACRGKNLSSEDLSFVKPSWAWSQDESELGTKDFCSTKRNIKSASLKNSEGYGVFVHSNGKQHIRSFLEKDQVGFLIADFDNNGYSAFFDNFKDGTNFDGRFANSNSLVLERGKIVKGTVRLEFLTP